MSNRLNQEREKELSPKRMETAIAAIENLGYKITFQDDTKICFWYRGNAVHFYYYSGWATGKGIRDGRGLQHLLEQIKH